MSGKDTLTANQTVFRLTGAAMDYDWGMQDPNCLAARFSRTTNSQFAEAWFGTHPKGPACIEYQSELAPISQFFPEMSYLVKALSIRDPLSIQVHPAAEHTARLHSADPNAWDAGVKHEAFLAYTQVDLAYGFRSAEHPASFLDSCPEVAWVLSQRNLLEHLHHGPSETHFFKTLLGALIHAPAQLIRDACARMKTRIEAASTLRPWEQWALKLFSKYPEGDIGLLLLGAVNVISVSPGEVVFTPAGRIHAYLGGELLEVMCTSDNVIRAGLTNKHIDNKEFLTCVEMCGISPAEWVSNGITRFHNLQSHWFDGCDSFAIHRVSQGTHRIAHNGEAVIALSIDANGMFAASETAIRPYEAYYLPARNEHTAVQINSGSLTVFHKPEVF